MNSVIRSYKDLIVWQRAMQLTAAVYSLTENFPSTEQFGLISQMQRSAVSIASNIAEGRHRGTRKEFRHFLLIAYASGAELETQISLSKMLLKTALLDYAIVDRLLLETMKMLNKMIYELRGKA